MVSNIKKSDKALNLIDNALKEVLAEQIDPTIPKPTGKWTKEGEFVPDDAFVAAGRDGGTRIPVDISDPHVLAAKKTVLNASDEEVRKALGKTGNITDEDRARYEQLLISYGPGKPLRHVPVGRGTDFRYEPDWEEFKRSRPRKSSAPGVQGMGYQRSGVKSSMDPIAADVLKFLWYFDPVGLAPDEIMQSAARNSGIAQTEEEAKAKTDHFFRNERNALTDLFGLVVGGGATPGTPKFKVHHLGPKPSGPVLDKLRAFYGLGPPPEGWTGDPSYGVKFHHLTPQVFGDTPRWMHNHIVRALADQDIAISLYYRGDRQIPGGYWHNSKGHWKAMTTERVPRVQNGPHGQEEVKATKVGEKYRWKRWIPGRKVINKWTYEEFKYAFAKHYEEFIDPFGGAIALAAKLGGESNVKFLDPTDYPGNALKEIRCKAFGYWNIKEKYCDEQKAFETIRIYDPLAAVGEASYKSVECYNCPNADIPMRKIKDKGYVLKPVVDSEIELEPLIKKYCGKGWSKDDPPCARALDKARLARMEKLMFLPGANVDAKRTNLEILKENNPEMHDFVVANMPKWRKLYEALLTDPDKALAKNYRRWFNDVAEKMGPWVAVNAAISTANFDFMKKTAREYKDAGHDHALGLMNDSLQTNLYKKLNQLNPETGDYYTMARAKDGKARPVFGNYPKGELVEKWGLVYDKDGEGGDFQRVGWQRPSEVPPNHKKCITINVRGTEKKICKSKPKDELEKMARDEKKRTKKLKDKKEQEHRLPDLGKYKTPEGKACYKFFSNRDMSKPAVKRGCTCVDKKYLSGKLPGAGGTNEWLQVWNECNKEHEEWWKEYKKKEKAHKRRLRIEFELAPDACHGPPGKEREQCRRQVHKRARDMSQAAQTRRDEYGERPEGSELARPTRRSDKILENSNKELKKMINKKELQKEIKKFLLEDDNLHLFLEQPQTRVQKAMSTWGPESVTAPAETPKKVPTPEEKKEGQDIIKQAKQTPEGRKQIEDTKNAAQQIKATDDPAEISQILQAFSGVSPFGITSTFISLMAVLDPEVYSKVLALQGQGAATGGTATGGGGASDFTDTTAGETPTFAGRWPTAEEMGWVYMASDPPNVMVQQAVYRGQGDPTDSRNAASWGTPKLKNYLLSLGKIGGKWYIGDLSRKTTNIGPNQGGDQKKHVSHQSGIGVDISIPMIGGATTATPGELVRQSKRNIGKKSGEALPWEFTGVRKGRGPQIHSEFQNASAKTIDTDATLNFLQHTSRYAKRVFLDGKFKGVLQQRAKQLGMEDALKVVEWMYKDEGIHLDHFHVRMKGSGINDPRGTGRIPGASKNPRKVKARLARRIKRTQQQRQVAAADKQKKPGTI